MSSNFKVYSGAGFTLIPEDEFDKLHIYVAIILTNVFFQPTQFNFFFQKPIGKLFYLTPPIQRTYAREMGNGLVRQ